MSLYRLYLLRSANIVSYEDRELETEAQACSWAEIVSAGQQWELWDFGSPPARYVAASKELSLAG